MTTGDITLDELLACHNMKRTEGTTDEQLIRSIEAWAALGVFR